MSLSKTTHHTAWPVFLIFLRLGLTSFGGPIAHLGYFRNEFVMRRQWLTEHAFIDLVALCQFLPGPASSQVGISIGLSRAGYAGALAAWLGFTLPSALIMILFALGLSNLKHIIPIGVLHGLKIVAVAVVAQAVWGMARTFCTDVVRIAVMIGACGMVLVSAAVMAQVGVILIAGLIGVLFLKPGEGAEAYSLPRIVSRRMGLICLTLFFFLLICLPILAHLSSEKIVGLIDAFYRVGSLVFGGGHIVLPLLQSEHIIAENVSNEVFVSGYGVAQALPGPLFTFAGFLGTSISGAHFPWLNGIISLLAIFLPSFLLILGALPFWESLRSNARMRAALAGINAAVVGLLMAALYHPIWTSAIHQLSDIVLAFIALIALMYWKLPPWLVVIVCGLGGWVLNLDF